MALDNLLKPRAGPKDDLIRPRDNLLTSAQRWNLVKYILYRWVHLCFTKDTKFHLWEGNPGSLQVFDALNIRRHGDSPKLQSLCYNLMLF